MLALRATEDFRPPVFLPPEDLDELFAALFVPPALGALPAVRVVGVDPPAPIPPPVPRPAEVGLELYGVRLAFPAVLPAPNPLVGAPEAGPPP
ncbi:MAG: hypothetical protein M3P26_04025 [Gemmatimonadota bacterium]|nr:hypothetical protein [Gemmatimonadota bacterium]